MHRGDEPHAVAGAAAVVDFVLPQRGAGKGIHSAAGGAVQKHRLGKVDVAFQHQRVEQPLVIGEGANRVGAGDVGGAAVVLAAVIHQQESPPLNDAVHLALGVVVHHGRVGTVGGDGAKAVVKIAGLFAAAGL